MKGKQTMRSLEQKQKFQNKSEINFKLKDKQKKLFSTPITDFQYK